MLQPSKSFWPFYRASVSESRAFLSIVVGGSALIPVLVCAMLPSTSVGATLLRLFACWGCVVGVYFLMSVLLVWVDYCEGKSRKQPGGKAQRRKTEQGR